MVQKLNLKKRNNCTKLQCNDSLSSKVSSNEENVCYKQLLDWLANSNTSNMPLSFPTTSKTDDQESGEITSKKPMSNPRESSQRQRFHRETRKALKMNTVSSNLMEDSSKKIQKPSMKNIRKPVHRTTQIKNHSLKQSAAGKWKKSINNEVLSFYDDYDEEDRYTPDQELPESSNLREKLVEHQIAMPKNVTASFLTDFEDGAIFLPIFIESDEEFDTAVYSEITWDPPERLKLHLEGFEVLNTKYPNFQLGNTSPRCLSLDLTPYIDSKTILGQYRNINHPDSARLALLWISFAEDSSRDHFSVAFHVSWSYTGLSSSSMLQEWMSKLDKTQNIDALIKSFLNNVLYKCIPSHFDWSNCSSLKMANSKVLKLANESSDYGCDHSFQLIHEISHQSKTLLDEATIAGESLDDFLEGSYDALAEEMDDLALICGACLDFIEQSDGYLQVDSCRHLLCVKCWSKHLSGCFEEIFKIKMDKSYLIKLANIDVFFSCPVDRCSASLNKASLLKLCNINVLNPIWNASEFAKKLLSSPSIKDYSNHAWFICPAKSCSKVFTSPLNCCQSIQGIECCNQPLLTLCNSSLKGLLFPWPSIDSKSPNCLYYEHEIHWPATCNEASAYHLYLSNLQNDIVTNDESFKISKDPIFDRVKEARKLRTNILNKFSQGNLKESTISKLRILVNTLSAVEYGIINALINEANKSLDHVATQKSTALKIIELCSSLKGEKFEKNFSEIHETLKTELVKLT